MPPKQKAAASRAAIELISSNSNHKRTLKQNPEDAPNPKRRAQTTDNSSEDGSEDGSDSPSEIDWAARMKERAVEKAKEEEQERQPWPTEMTGEWKITTRSDATILGSMHIYYDDGRTPAGRRQYYADFKISDNWHGIMRFCPVSEIKPQNKVAVEEFEKACILKDGVKAGAPPTGVHEWFIKWRGTLIDESRQKYIKPSPTDTTTTRITFKLGENGKMVAGFILVEHCMLRFFTAERIGDGKQRGLNDPTIEELWEEKKFVPPPPPPPPRLWPWKSPLPTKMIEAPPAWAWDVLGKWKITAPEVAKALKIDETAPMLMTIRLANDAKNRKNGRQLWATFNFGPISGCMRFCPLPENSRKADTVTQFEKKCVLKKLVWPGDSASEPGKSFQKWGFRYRGEGESMEYGDTFEEAFNFSRDEDGTLKLQGVFCARWQMLLWSAVKIQDGDLDTEADIKAIWDSF